MIRIGIIGGESPAAGELIRLLVVHPEADLVFIHSAAHVGRLLSEVHTGLIGETDQSFTAEMPFEAVDLVFLCLSAGESRQFMDSHYIPADVRLIDLSPDYRTADEDNDFVYGLPELRRSQIVNALHVANPGAVATALQLALLPPAEAGLLHQIPEDGLRAFMAHSAAVETEVSDAAARSAVSLEAMATLRELEPDVQFPPTVNHLRLPVDHALYAVVTAPVTAPLDEIEGYFADFYSEAPFTHYVGPQPDFRQVAGTNKALIHAESSGSLLTVTVVLDDRLKALAGQAVQNMNLMFGLEETTGLRLKPLG